ncbi:F-box protein SKIP23-like protein [Carex littledalei]|uniref:F-box protein SKIP23-like protein n=1 Tax=Carex littledalei TaxID=544730 RepID=A0A833QZN4_9POAL|nr:F-box protein SKIP23-like protein [Carex littledalei]
MANWSELPQDPLELITSYLSLTDVNRFSAVCQPWRFIAKMKRYAPVPQLPWVILTEDRETQKRKFFNMSEQRHYYIDLPELRGGYCVGCSFGWLFIVSPNIELYLVNPFTGVRYCLPPLPFLNEGFGLDNSLDGEFVDEEPYDEHSTTWYLKLLQKLTISRAVLSHDPNKCEDFFTMIYVRGSCRMAFCRPKDNIWTIVPHSPINDVICYKGNFYAVAAYNNLYEVHLGPDPEMRLIDPWVQECITGESRYLVDYFGKHLLLVCRNKVKCRDDDTAKEQDEDGDSDGEFIRYRHGTRTTFFAVFELDLEKEEWHRWNDLGGNALFVGTNRAIVGCASKFPGCKADCIYFTSDSTDFLASNKYGYNDVGVYNLIEDRMEAFYEDHIPNTSMPTWLLPNP